MSEDNVVDLMAALEASVKEAKAARTRHPAGSPAAEDEPAPAKKRTRKSA
jgi:non-homologous end joining protein Ku